MQIGIASGHSRSYGIMYSTKTNVLYKKVEDLSLSFHTFKHSNIIIRFEKLLKSLAAEADVNSINELTRITKRIAVSLPGAALGEEQRIATDTFRSYISLNDSELVVVDDTWSGLYAEAGEARGVCAFAGTGASVCVALGSFVADKRDKIDGWGPIIGDHGSAFDLVCEFFRQLGRLHDAGKKSLLFKEVQRYINSNTSDNLPSLDGIDHIQKWFDMIHLDNELDWRVRFARIAVPITKAAESDSVSRVEARQLVDRCATRMAESIKIALDKYSVDSAGLPIILQGGMFRYSPCYRESVLQHLGDEARSRAKLARFEPVIGSLFLATGDPEHIDKIRQKASST